MNIAHLINTASQLKQPEKRHAQEYIEKSGQLAEKMNSYMQNRPDIKALVGENNLEMMKDNHANHVRFIGSILYNHEPEVLVNTILWVFRAYRSHGFVTNYWAAQLNTWIIVIKELLSENCFNEVFPFYEWMQINIPVFVTVSDQKLEDINSMH